jgi:hypothetical protein
MNYFESLNDKKFYDSRAVFIQDIEEITSVNKKILHISVKDRSNTSNSINTNMKTAILDPKNEKRMSINYSSNPLENMKIPKNNPLANMNSNFNKFDDPNLNINPMSLALNSLTFDK